MNFSEQAGEILAAMRDKRPLVHCITNYVTAADTANMLLAAGASPIMSDDPNETAEVAAASDALVLNMGTLSERHALAMLAAGRAANKKGIPVVLDPVGVGLTAFRKETAKAIFREIGITAVRGNAAEISALAELFRDSPLPHGGALACGVDCMGGETRDIAENASLRLGCVCAVTGGEDVISDGVRTITLHGGTQLLRQITGAGCMASALCGAFCSAAEPLYGAAMGTAFMRACGELAAEKAALMGTLHTELFNAACMDGKAFCERLRADEH